MEKKFRRKLTPFLCKEMLYDYATDRLDEDRKQAVSEFIKGDRECQDILEGIQRGLECTERLSKTELSQEIISQLREADNALSLGRRYSSWREWPESLRWSVIAISASASAAVIIALVPWKKLPTFEAKKNKATDVVELAQIPTADGRLVLDSANPAEEATDEGSGDEMFDPGSAPPGAQVAAGEESPADEHAGHDHGEEESPLPSAQVPVAAPAIAANVAKPGAKAEKAKIDTAVAKQNLPSSSGGSMAVVSIAPTMAPLAPMALPQMPAPKKPAEPLKPVQAKATPAPIAAKAPGRESSPDASDTRESKGRGFVFRAFMNLANLEELAPKITDNIIDFGGEKAGEVELGWKRGSGRYYHFAMPESNQEKLLETLRAYGPVRISKDPHPRVMPEGQVRFILWVEAAN